MSVQIPELGQVGEEAGTHLSASINTFVEPCLLNKA